MFADSKLYCECGAVYELGVAIKQVSTAKTGGTQPTDKQQAKHKICPRCGGAGQVYMCAEDGDDKRYYMHCDSCGCTGPVAKTRELALDMWGRRGRAPSLPCPHWYNIDRENLDLPAQNRCNHPDAWRW